MPKPLVGITCDIVLGDPLGSQGHRLRAQSPLTYADAVVEAGGTPILLPPRPDLAAQLLAACQAVVFTGGADPRMEPFGLPTHPAANLMHPQRQAFESTLLAELDRQPHRPVLGVCLGMQLMALHAGGRLNQCLADTLASHQRHVKDFAHPVAPTAVIPGPAGAIQPGPVASNHRQAVSDAGRLRVIAKSDDGVIEAVDDPARPFYLGVQWHPERTGFAPLGLDLFRRLVAAAVSS